MKITDKDVQYVADLAHLELTAEERTRMAHDLGSILGYIDRLNELDTTGVPPMTQVSGHSGNADSKKDDRKYDYAQRPDLPKPCLPREAAMQNAPDTDGVFFRVPKVIER
jgi:aspartyl-tRNA(Asn)/glutamyl-tRNA(Gln) amidotransferase subunit C